MRGLVNRWQRGYDSKTHRPALGRRSSTFARERQVVMYLSFNFANVYTIISYRLRASRNTGAIGTYVVCIFVNF